MTGYVDEDIIKILTAHGPMTAMEMRDLIYPGTPSWDYNKRNYIYNRCWKMMRHR